MRSLRLMEEAASMLADENRAPDAANYSTREVKDAASQIMQQVHAIITYRTHDAAL